VFHLYYKRHNSSQPTLFSSERTEGSKGSEEIMPWATFASFAGFCSKLLLVPFPLLTSVQFLWFRLCRSAFHPWLPLPSAEAKKACCKKKLLVVCNTDQTTNTVVFICENPCFIGGSCCLLFCVSACFCG